MNKTPKKYLRLCVYLILALVTLTAFWQLRQNEFISFDDDVYILDNNHVKAGLTRQGFIWAFTEIHAYNWHPLTWLSHMLDCQLYGLNAGGHHLTNVLFHIANSLLLLLVFSRMTGNFWAGTFIAAAFALHPLHVESVAWASERKDMLSTFFWLLTMLAYTHYVKRPEVKKYLLTLLLFTLGLMAKQMLVTLPFVLLLLDYWPLKRLALKGQTPSGPVTFRRCILEKLPFLILSVVAGFTVYHIQRQTGVVRLLTECPLAYRIGNAFVAYIVYIGKMFWPARLAIFYPHPGDSLQIWKITASASLLILITITVIRKARTRPYLVVGWLWFLGTLVPVIGLVQVGDQALADRYSYITLTGLFIMIAWGVPELLARLHYRKIILSIFAIILLLALGTASRLQAEHWRNNTTLYSHAAKVVKNNWWAYNNFGIALSKQGKLNEALSYFNKAIDIKPNYDKAHNNLGNTLQMMGKLDGATDSFRQALQINPNYTGAHNNLGIILAQQGKLDDALVHFECALQLDPDQPMRLNAVARILATHPDPKMRDADRAITLAERAVELSDHQNPIILNTLAAGYAAADQFDQAVTAAQAALELAVAEKNHQLAEHTRSRLDFYKQQKASLQSGQSQDKTSP